MAYIKLKWRVDPPPTGRYRSFEKRSWPLASYPDGSSAFYIRCEDEYTPSSAKNGKHKELTLCVAVYKPEGVGFDWRVVKQRFTTLTVAKEAAQVLINNHLEWGPPHYRK